MFSHIPNAVIIAMIVAATLFFVTAIVGEIQRFIITQKEAEYKRKRPERIANNLKSIINGVSAGVNNTALKLMQDNNKCAIQIDELAKKTEDILAQINKTIKDLEDDGK